ncbi:nitroreductase family protein [Nonomuraea sp. MG754425]|uniref:nitroreductase family protein n=1 Tax=Nonomuraea sp. MG754425 TaxID=2570319 RepID=UPI001F3B405C|nr:nitroreductase family protein [Nonomuraea sp. MG754425]MCF6474384.1 nitroreductase family protein [Nonomuraea sp. MG754425]
MEHRHPFVPYTPPRYAPEEMVRRGEEFHRLVRRRRSVRAFSAEPVPYRCVELAVRAAGTAPSGAHQQPWKFVAIGDQETRRRVREAAEIEERQNYEGGRLPPDWRAALEPIGTTSDKAYLETAPWLVVCFAEKYGRTPEGEKVRHYYVNESVGIACGLFVTALHTMGLATLTHTPNPMAFLSDICHRPTNERPYILFPVGYAAERAEVPDLTRKPLSDILIPCP